MTTKKIDITKTYTTRVGNPVQIYAVHDTGDYPVHGAILDKGIWTSENWTLSGHFIRNDTDDNDLFQVKARIQHTVKKWANVYYRHACLHDDREEADTMAYEERLACIPVEIKIDCEEDEGLDSI